MQSTSAPNKYLVPFAQNDTGKVEIPVTTTDATRASQSLGFPPLTMQPPEVGGVPPQGQDFNGAMNQVARVAWWLLLGSAFVYDNTFATNTNIGGYPKGSQLLRADLAGLWLNNAENNVTNPDDNTGAAAGWLPGYTYGAASIAVSTATTVNPVNAAFKTLLLTGTLTANSVVNLPAWVYDWRIVDNTVRAGFSLNVKTASGTGVVISAGAQFVRGDGTNIIQPAESIAAATAPAQAVQAGQVVSGTLGTATAGGTANAITASFAASPAAYTAGQPFTIISATSNTGAMTATLTLGGVVQAAVPIVKGNNVAVAGGDYPAGYPGEFAYSPAFAALVLNNPANGISSGGGRLINTIYYSVVAQTVTLSIANPGVVTYASADKLPLPNAPIVFSTTGALPTGLVAGTTYYVKSPSGTTSQVSATPGGAAIVTTGTQSGTQSVANPAYTKATNNPSFVITEVWAGGGGAGGMVASANAIGGGGAGGFTRQKILSAALLTTESVTVGAGGAAGAATGGTNGGTGGTSSFGAHSSATGGLGSLGVATATSGSNSGAVGGTGVGGDLNLTGAAGSAATGAGGNPYAIGGAGGASSLGGNGYGVGGTGSLPGVPAATNSASGAGGGLGVSAQNGAVGGSGFIIVYEYA